MKQKDLIKDHLEKYGSITSWEAFSKYHITRVGALVYLLRKDGMNIISIPSESNGQVGNTYAIYTLVRED